MGNNVNPLWALLVKNVPQTTNCFHDKLKFVICAQEKKNPKTLTKSISNLSRHPFWTDFYEIISIYTDNLAIRLSVTYLIKILWTITKGTITENPWQVQTCQILVLKLVSHELRKSWTCQKSCHRKHMVAKQFQ